ncbi:1-acyl-sn-glycerol-3-phosphate acyltransferase delta-like [Oppia nitens]|uniref:1-acyl-sn-glycerol-3-phosphate acyltransferase delta-like n=1 Tax=Oppia nitens TaxID=1686743 RepID=UPI0023DADA69|nr:1-acyl-sn-glycerol-3-phosphate acyltransferase delta-like [Oppia nitens]
MLDQLHKSKTLRVLFMLSFFISGLIINFVQFSLYITVRYFDRKLYRRLNYYLVYTMSSQIVAISEWWSGSRLRMFFADEDSLRSHGKHHVLYVMNHRYELDWLYAWMVLDKFEILGNAKSFAKKSLRWLPIIGWNWVLDEFIFLDRDWKKDQQNLPKALDQLMAYESPISLLLFSEGTRFTESKYEASLEFAKQRGLPQLKYHLLPRTKGFAFCIRHIKKHYPDTVIYDIQLRFSDNAKHLPTFTSIVKGKQLVGDFYLRKVPISQVPTDSEDDISNFLYDFYQKKDNLMDYHKENDKFPGILVDKPRRIVPLINWMSWFAVVMISLTYILFNVFTSGNLYLIITTTVIFAIALGSVYVMIGSTKIQKGSKYGNKVKSGDDNHKDVDSKNSTQNNNFVDNSSLRQRLNTSGDDSKN